MMNTNLYIIDKTWNNLEIHEEKKIYFSFAIKKGALSINFTAPFRKAMAPPYKIDEIFNLWDYEVVELFLADKTGHYLELEFGPFGHSLYLEFFEIRNPVRRETLNCYKSTIIGKKWTGTALIEKLPLDPKFFNIYSITGPVENREYLAFNPMKTEKPDFHRLEFFKKL